MRLGRTAYDIPRGSGFSLFLPALTIQRIELLPPTVFPPTIIVYIIGNRTAISPFPSNLRDSGHPKKVSKSLSPPTIYSFY